jgi:hypothetical protein
MRDSGLTTPFTPGQNPGTKVVPYLPGNWAALSVELVEALRNRAAMEGVVDFADRVTRVRVLPLPCFPSWLLCDFLLGDVGAVEASEVAAFAIMYGPNGFTSLEDPGALLRHAKAHGVDLSTAENCAFYAEFAVAAGIFGTEWSLPLDVDDKTLVEIPGRVLNSPLDAIRSPEAARILLRSFLADELFQLTIRLSVDGEIMLLEKTKLAETVQHKLRTGRPLRVAARPTDD